MDKPWFKSVKRVLLPDMVVEQIKEMIADGTLKLGERIPSETDLANQLSVGRTTVREAIKALCVIGVLSRTNAGTFVSNDISIINSEPLTYKLLIQNDTRSEVYEARWSLEGEIAALAAKRASEDDILQLENAIKQSQLAIDNEDHDAYFKADMDFHIGMADAAGNSVLFELYSVVYEIMLRSYDKTYRLIDQKDFQNWGVNNHIALLEAIKAKDSELARLLARKPMAEVTEKLSNALRDSKKMKEV